MSKCEFKNCPKEAEYRGHVYGRIKGETGPDRFIEVKVCKLHGHDPDLWEVEKINQWEENTNE